MVPGGRNAQHCARTGSVLSEIQGLPWELDMPALVTTATLSRPLVFLGLAGALLLAVALGLWAHYGTVVFFEIVRTGWLACF